MSISGPSLDHAGHFLRTRARRRPDELIRQLLHSWYVFYFHLPRIPERGWRKGWAHRVFGRLERAAGGIQSAPGERSLADYLSVQVVRGGHWLPRNDPGLVARLTLEHTRRVAGWQT